MNALVRTMTYACYGLTLACAFHLLYPVVRVRVRRGKGSKRTPWFTRSVSMLGFALALSTPAAASGSRRPDPPYRRAAAAVPPWSQTGGSPPRPPVGSGARQFDEAMAQVHPAIHGRRIHRSADLGPLFPREGRARVPPPTSDDSEPARSEDRCAERRACMAAHPSSRPRFHVVRPGDSLWTIASAVLGTEDPVPVARYWARIHRANREVIGPNPDLIYPGQKLTLPSARELAQDR